MKTILFTIFYSLNYSYALADEVKCSGYNAPPTPSSLENLVNDCALQKNLASDPLVQQEHRKKVYGKLADKLATQIKQNSENISMLTTFYNANGQDLMMNSKDVAQSCRLDAIKSIETCGGKNSGPLQKYKLDLLKSKLPKSKNTPFSNDSSLYGIMAGKFYSDLGMNDKENTLQCPIAGAAGSFMLQSQLDEVSAEEIARSINSNGFNSQIFEEYPQLKIIQNAKDPAFVESFLSYVKNKPASSKAKDYIAKFFFDSKNQQKLAPTLADQCGRITQNLNEFLCSDITELGSLDDNASRNLFNKLNTTDSMEDQYEVDFSDPTDPNEPSVLTAYGLQCLAKEKKMSQSNKSLSENGASIDNWYDDFTNNIRAEESEEKSKTVVGQFCSMYTCQDANSKKQDSCKTGGPLASAELRKSLGCDLIPVGNNCNVQGLKNIAYMESLEKLKKDSKDQVATKASSTSSATSSTDASNSTEEKIVSGRLPNFASNYFGVEGSLKALGKPVTTFAVTEKKQEFAEKKLASADPVYKTPEVMKAQQPKAPPAVATADNSSVRPSYTPTRMTQTAPQAKTASAERTGLETNFAAKTTKTKAQKVIESDSLNESSRLRDEMEKMIADIKSTKQEISASHDTIAASESALGNKAYSASNGLVSPVNRAEQERLKRLEQSLNDKANRLEDYRRELDNRNFAQTGSTDDGANRSTASNGSGGGGGSAGGSGGSMGGGSASSGSGSAAKLTAGGNAKVDGKNNNTAALIQSGVESSTLTVDELSHLSPENLKKLGIDSTRPFTLKVTFESKTYEVPVKSFIYKGANILGPIMDPRNKELNDFLMKSPLFKQYIDYKFAKENQSGN